MWIHNFDGNFFIYQNERCSTCLEFLQHLNLMGKNVLSPGSQTNTFLTECLFSHSVVLDVFHVVFLYVCTDSIVCRLCFPPGVKTPLHRPRSTTRRPPTSGNAPSATFKSWPHCHSSISCRAIQFKRKFEQGGHTATAWWGDCHHTNWCTSGKRQLFGAHQKIENACSVAISVEKQERHFFKIDARQAVDACRVAGPLLSCRETHL